MQKNFYLITRNATDLGKITPILWCSAKTYYEENGRRADEWYWADPWLGDDLSVDEILSKLEDEPPAVLGCSVYLWNISYMDELAEKVKMRFPDCLVVYGGPQADIKYSDDFFKLNPWVDLVCPSDAYGEIIISAILDNHPIDDFEKIPYVYYTDQTRSKIMSKTGIEKRSFKWPSNIFQAQERHIKDKGIVHAHYESSRGCPYKCIYCDWGGGTYTKVSKKPFGTILSELEWLAKNQIRDINIVDANFGIMDIDIEIARYICEYKTQYGYPRAINMELSKNNLERNVKILEMFISRKMMPWYKISIQAIDEDIKNNIDRIDVPFLEQVKWFKYFKKKYPYITTKIEIIMGLPGDNYEKVLDQINLHLENDLPISRSELWALLPEAPAFSPEMRDRFQIKTMRKSFANHVWSMKPGRTPDFDVIRSQRQTNGDKIEYVIGTYSYDVHELIDMFLVNSLGSASISVGLDRLIKYCSQTHQVRHVEILDFIYKDFVLKPEKFSPSPLNHDFDNLIISLKKYFLDDQTKTSMLDYHDDLPFLMPATLFIVLAIASNASDFYSTVSTALADRYQDNKIQDLGVYLSNILIDLKYDFDQGREFVCEYDWLSYFEGQDLGGPGQYHFEVSDQSLERAAGDPMCPDWHKYEPGSILQKKQYFYQGTMSMLFNSLLAKKIQIRGKL